MRRIDCKRCQTPTVEMVPWAHGKHRLTLSFIWFLSTWSKRMSWKEVAFTFATSWDSVFRSVEFAVDWGRKRLDLSGIKALGVDEIQWKIGHKYLTLVYQVDQHCKRLLWIGKDRTEETFRSFFDWFTDERAKLVEYICSDMWKAFIKVIREKASDAVHILDRFHIMSHFSKAIDEVRAAEARQMREEGYEPVLKHSRFLLLRRPENLTDKQEASLRDLLRYNLKSVRAYLLKEDFQQFWEYDSPAWAGKFLDRWCARAMRSKLDPVKKVAKMLRKHRELLLNWFRARGQISAGAVEGKNNKAKLIMRTAYGFKSFRTIEVALYHKLGELPEPEFAHRFC